MLQGTPTLKIILDQKEVNKLLEAINSSVERTNAQVCEDVAKAAVGLLSGMDAGAGHHFLAGQWAYEGPVTNGLSAEAIVYSKAEETTFSHESVGGGHSPPITGADLISILEYGAKAHTIAPVNAKALAFASTKGWHTSVFAGTVVGQGKKFLGKKNEISGFLFAKAPEDTLFFKSVNHPGVTGNRFLQITRDLLIERLAQFAANRFSQIVPA